MEPKSPVSPALAGGLFYHQYYLRLPGGSDGKESAYNAGDLSSIPGLGRSPGEESVKPLQYSCLEKSHGQRSLVGYSILAWKIPWMEEKPGGLESIGFKESDTTEVTTHTQTLPISFFLWF